MIDACRRSLPVDSTQAIRKRTRAGMGGCQGKPWNYGCECRVAQIIARENSKAGAAVPVPAVGRRPWAATSAFAHRWLTDADKEELQQLSKVADGQEEDDEQAAAAAAAAEAEADPQARETLMEALKKGFLKRSAKKSSGA